MTKTIQKTQKTPNTGVTNNVTSKPFFTKNESSSFFPPENSFKNESIFRSREKSDMTHNNTGIPDQLKKGIENLSGISISDVKVHRNSSRPKQLDALAYTQGTDIYVAPGQEKLLPHEAWHVIQQKQGRVTPTGKLGRDHINDNVTLEQEATEMGNKALHTNDIHPNPVYKSSNQSVHDIQRFGVIQREPIPASAIILDVNASAETVLQLLIATAGATSRQYSSVNWRNMFLGVITQQLRGRSLGTITHTWRDNAGLDCDWSVTINFDQTGANRTSRPTEQRDITNASGGSSSNSLGSSLSDTSGSSVSVTGGSSSSVGAESGPVSAEAGSSRSGTVGLSDSHTSGSSGSSGGGLSAGSSAVSRESVTRYLASLRVNIDCTAEAAYSNWDIINPVKWGAHLAGRQHQNYTFFIGTLTYDLPNY